MTRCCSARLEVLNYEHRDLDHAILALEESGRADQLRLRRLKKQKLQIKDQIAAIEDEMFPGYHCVTSPARYNRRAQRRGRVMRVGIVMGSRSDWPTLKEAAAILEELEIAHEARIVSAHRTPDRLWRYGAEAEGPRPQGYHRRRRRCRASAGNDGVQDGLPVIGVPVRTAALGGVDSLYSIVQMPRGYPVATMAIGGAAECRPDGRADPRAFGCGSGQAARSLARGADRLDTRDTR